MEHDCWLLFENPFSSNVTDVRCDNKQYDYLDQQNLSYYRFNEEKELRPRTETTSIRLK
jgi:hypothetical protein